jgi:hypothetical protein
VKWEQRFKRKESNPSTQILESLLDFSVLIRADFRDRTMSSGVSWEGIQADWLRAVNDS